MGIERGQSNQIESFVWQTDTCLGSWHYNRQIYENNRYKTAKTVIHTLAGVVSKNGNLLLSVPVRGDGSIDEKETAIMERIANWMAVNKESIFETRPWSVFGEGPAIESAAPLNTQGFNEGKGKPFGPEDIRFTTKGNALYAIMMDWPTDGKAQIKTIRSGNNALKHALNKVELLGHSQSLSFTSTGEALEITFPDRKPSDYAYCLKIT